jgi:hypothetical protein
MRRVLISTTAGLLFLAGATATVGKPADKKSSNSEQALVNGLHAVAESASSQSKATPAKTEDHDQGDDHASDRAIFRVCNHDNPSAQRAAICNPQVSPE